MTHNNLSEKIRITDLLSEGKSVQLHPQGYSMYPLIVPDRDEVIIVPVKNHKIRRGDVLLYRRKNGKLILHRVYRVKNEKLYFAGDNESVVEGPLEMSQIEGIMVSFIRKGKKYKISNILYFIYWQLWLLVLPFRKNIGKAVHKIKSGS
ncbi:MAG: S24/S26 family peptidase [Lachnospiraceae bacterium]|nr:S24/S26 family peptidase [Lachnospiraceae bacterium]